MANVNVEIIARKLAYRDYLKQEDIVFPSMDQHIAAKEYEADHWEDFEEAAQAQADLLGV